MKLKTKLCSTIVMFCLTIVTLMVGVWAVKSANVNIGGTLSFVAQGIEATISQGTMTNGTWQTASHATTKLKQIEITKTDTTSTLSSKFSSWSGINLNFNENGDDITISFSITNNSAQNSIAVDVSTTYTSATNCTIAIDTSSATIDANASQNFTLTMKITDKDINASMTNFTVIFNMQHEKFIPPVDVEDVPSLIFTITNTTNKTCSVKSNPNNKPTGQLTIPNIVIIDEQEYAVTEIGLGEEYTEENPYTGEWKTKYRGGFENNTGLTSLSLPDNIISIPDNAFKGCTNLESIKLPKNATGTLGSQAFANCSKLTELEIPAGITVLGSSCFSGCSFDTLTLKGVQYCGESAFGCTINTLILYSNCIIDGNLSGLTGSGLSELIFKEGVTQIPGNTFQSCASLTSITIPETVTTIEPDAFYNCTNLTYNTYDNAKYLGNSTNPYVALIETTSTSITSCTINSSCKVIVGKAFSGCTSLTTITIPNSVTSIGDYAFLNCTGLTSVTIGSGVTSIGYLAFSGCTNLAEVNVKATSVPTGGSSMFNSCSSALVIYVPTASVDAYKAATNWSTYSSKIVGKSSF